MPAITGKPKNPASPGFFVLLFSIKSAYNFLGPKSKAGYCRTGPFLAIQKLSDAPLISARSGVFHFQRFFTNPKHFLHKRKAGKGVIFPAEHMKKCKAGDLEDEKRFEK